MPFSIGTPTKYQNQPASASHSVTLPSSSSGDIIFVVAQVSFAATSLTIDNVSFSTVFTTNSTGNRRIRVFARVVDGSEPANLTMTIDGSSFTLNAAVYAISGASLTLSSIELNNTVSNGAESPNYNPPSLTSTQGEANYLWFAVVASDPDGGFTAGPTSYQFEALTSGSTGSQVSMGVAYRELLAETEDPSAFTAASSSPSATVTLLIPESVAQPEATLSATPAFGQTITVTTSNWGAEDPTSVDITDSAANTITLSLTATATEDEYTFTMPTISETEGASISGLLSGSGTIRVYSATGDDVSQSTTISYGAVWENVATLESGFNTEPTSQLTPSPVAGDQLAGQAEVEFLANGNINADEGTWPVLHIQASTGTIYTHEINTALIEDVGGSGSASGLVNKAKGVKIKGMNVSAGKVKARKLSG